jgi:DNA-binding Xre family transcriptional regulator
MVSYKKLWKLLIDKDMKKRDLMAAAKISNATVSKMGHGENLNTEILVRICNALQCTANDIMEITPEKPTDGGNA